MASFPSRWAITASATACVVVGILLLRDPIGRWIFPDAALAGLIAEADGALASGDLATAAARFDAAQARAPDHPRVLDGLASTRERSLAEAERAIDAGDAARVDEALARAARLGASRERIESLRQAMRSRTEPSIEAMLQLATAMESTEPSAALDLYRQVLVRAPGNALAIAGRRRLLSETLGRATVALDAGDTASATALVAEVRFMDPAHLQLPELEARLGALGVRIPGPNDVSLPASAVISAEDVAAAVRWRGLADEAIGRGAFADARRAIDEARRLAPAAVELAALEQRLQRAEAGRPDAR
jgi:tetratricopeptide (TPR) repeat protein